MNFKKSILNTSIAVAMGGVTMSANAALLGSTTAVLDFTGIFTMQTTIGLVPTNMSSGLDGGLKIGVLQPQQGGHPTHGGANHPNKGRLDSEWSFFGSAGQSWTKTAVTVQNDDVNNDGGFTKTLDFSGWRVAWNAIGEINMGGGLQNCGTSTDGICQKTDGSGNITEDVAGTFDNGTQLATITCNTASCSNSSTFSLNYAATVPQADASGFGGTPYTVAISGSVTPHIPVPAAVWLFGSGLVGLVGVARRKKAKV